MGKKLRLGLLIDNMAIPSWAFHMIEKIQASSYAEVVLVVKNKNQFSFKTPVLWKIYLNVDRTVFKENPDAFETKNLNELISAKTLQIEFVHKNGLKKIAQEDITRIRDYNIDVFIKLSRGNISKNIVELAKYGVWIFCLFPFF